MAGNLIGCVYLNMHPRTDCIALYVGRTAGSQTCGQNGFIILFMIMLTQLFMG